LPPAGGGGQSGGSNASTVTVSLLDPAGALAGAYYRVGSGNWQPINFTGGQFAFQASGQYEVVARCRGEPDRIYHTKATPSQLSRVVVQCSTVSATQARVTLTAHLPSSIGDTPIEDGSTLLAAELDVRFFPLLGWALIPERGQVQSRQAQLTAFFPPGLQDVLLTLMGTGVTGTGFSHCLQPIGWKRVRLDIADAQSYTVDENGWQAFHTTPSIRVSSGGNPSTPWAYVAYFKEGMKSLGYVGFSDGTTDCRYGTLPPQEGGVYLGIAVSATSFSESSFQAFAVLKDLRGQDWVVEMPPLWPDGALIVSGSTVTLSYPHALSYTLRANGFLQDRQTLTNIHLYATLFPGNGGAVYAPPDAGEELGYVVNPSDTYSVEALAFLRNTKGTSPSGLFGPGVFPDEATL